MLDCLAAQSDNGRGPHDPPGCIAGSDCPSCDALAGALDSEQQMVACRGEHVVAGHIAYCVEHVRHHGLSLFRICAEWGLPVTLVTLSPVLPLLPTACSKRVLAA